MVCKKPKKDVYPVNRPKDWVPFWETCHYFMFNSTESLTQKHEPFFLINSFKTEAVII